jgi:hypothetical protein
MLAFVSAAVAALVVANSPVDNPPMAYLTGNELTTAAGEIVQFELGIYAENDNGFHHVMTMTVASPIDWDPASGDPSVFNNDTYRWRFFGVTPPSLWNGNENYFYAEGQLLHDLVREMNRGGYAVNTYQTTHQPIPPEDLCRIAIWNAVYTTVTEEKCGTGTVNIDGFRSNLPYLTPLGTSSCLQPDFGQDYTVPDYTTDPLFSLPPDPTTKYYPPGAYPPNPTHQPTPTGPSVPGRPKAPTFVLPPLPAEWGENPIKLTVPENWIQDFWANWESTWNPNLPGGFQFIDPSLHPMNGTFVPDDSRFVPWWDGAGRQPGISVECLPSWPND